MSYHTNSHFKNFTLTEGLRREYLYIIYGEKLKKIYKLNKIYNDKKYIINRLKKNFSIYKLNTLKYIKSLNKNNIYNKALLFMNKQNENKINIVEPLSINIYNYFRNKYKL